jgi:glycosyltransferase involved in cell wall biosynthesis
MKRSLAQGEIARPERPPAALSRKRVLHVLGAMNRGGVETWLMHVLRRLQRDRVRMDFLVHTEREAEYDAEILALGSKILACPDPRNPLLYSKRFLQLVRSNGPYDVLHSHVHHHSGVVLWLGRRAGIPVRIAHSHNDLSSLAARATALRKGYLSLSQWLISVNCTQGLAASAPAARDLFGPRWPRDGRIQVLHCGVDLDPFRLQLDRDSVRAEFGFGPEHIVFGHTGRFEAQKNHAFLAEIASEIVKREPRARFLFVGDGPLRPAIERQFRSSGIGEYAVFAGLRPDVPRLAAGVMDGFLFPSLYEGLGLALIEAQAAGLPSTISDTVPAEATVIPKLVRPLSLKDPSSVWAECALQHRERAGNALMEMERSSFGIAASVGGLMRVYGVAPEEAAERPPSDG